jgi:hypothetical protein
LYPISTIIIIFESSNPSSFTPRHPKSMWFSAITDEEKEGAVSASVAATAATKLNSGDKSTTSSTTSTAPPIHYVSRRSPIYCTKACVATSQPLATSIGLHILRGCGGNAADASVAIAAALAVVSM